MNHKMIVHTTGMIIGVESICLLLSSLISLIYGEAHGMYLLIAALIAGAVFGITRFFKPKDQTFFAKEGFVTVAFSWLFLSLIGALPFCLSGEIPSYIDCFFETASGLSTTGASILDDVTALSHGMLFWRSLTHWIGGMGVLVLVLAVVPSATGRTIHMARAEMPGPTVGKLVPKMKDTAKILYIIYLVLTAVMAVLLACGGLSMFDSVLLAFGTAGTGGFGVLNDSIASYSSYIQWVITVFMFIFGINFNLFYLILIGKFSSAIKSRELWVYSGIVLVSSVAITVNLLSTFDGSAPRHAFFQVASIISTTGYSTCTIDALPAFSKGLIFILMFFGGCAGSTAGGLKISRIMLLFKVIDNRIKHILHPHNVKAIKFEGKTVDEDTANGVCVYFALYILCMAVLFLLLSLIEPFGLESNLTATVSTFNNVGPAYGAAASSYSAYSGLSKTFMSFAMLLGRLEIYPILITLSPSTWIKK